MPEKTRIEIALLLPTVTDARDACVQRLVDLLKANDGIEAAHSPDMKGNEPDQVCIHYDPEARFHLRSSRSAKYHRSGSQSHS